jgi:hypothetical protein
MMQLHYLTFGGPTESYRAAVQRLRDEAQQMNVFSSITTLTDVELQQDTAFWEKHGNFILSNPRGYGYWIWKPYLIQQKLLEIPDGDILLYSDAGCELNPYAKRRFFELVTKTTARKIIGTHCISTDITYTKQDTIIKMGMTGRIDLLQKNQVQSGCLMMLKCKEIVDLIDSWYKWCQDYHMIDDSPSVAPNSRHFIEHRHDQSVLNMLIKERGLYNYEIEPADNKIENPIWYCRNRRGPSIITEKPY